MWSIETRKARCDSVIHMGYMYIIEVQLGDSPHIKELEGKKENLQKLWFV